MTGLIKIFLSWLCCAYVSTLGPKALAGQPTAANCQHRFASHQSYQEQLKILLSDYENLKVTEPFNVTEFWTFQRIAAEDLSSGKKRAHIDFRYDESTRRLSILDLRVDAESRNQGLSKILFFKLLSIVESVEAIRSYLGIDNYAVFESHLDSGKSAKEAITLTPAYKIRLLAGFSTLVDDDSEDGFDHEADRRSFGFTVVR